MALTEFQRTLCRLIAQQRLDSGESYVAGGVALNTLTGATRISRDIDLFHDTTTAVAASWEADRKLLESHGYQVGAQREREAFVEAIVSRAGQSVAMQWAADSAFRFFPLVEHEDFGLTLHPFDLATNKVLALVGRLEARDWVDVINCHERIQRQVTLLGRPAVKTRVSARPRSWSKRDARRAIRRWRSQRWRLPALRPMRPNCRAGGMRCCSRRVTSSPLCRRRKSGNACWTRAAASLRVTPPNYHRLSRRAKCVSTRDGFAARCPRRV